FAPDSGTPGGSGFVTLTTDQTSTLPVATPQPITGQKEFTNPNNIFNAFTGKLLTLADTTANPLLTATQSGTGSSATFTSSSSTNATVNIAQSGTNAGVSFGSGNGANIYFQDGGAAQRLGVGSQTNELQFFIPTGMHMSITSGGDLQAASNPQEFVRFDATSK